MILQKSVILKYLALCRPAQQAKQLFVLAPLLYAVKGIGAYEIVQSSLSVILFVKLSTCIYCFNDLYDFKNGISSPETLNRPIVNGSINPISAWIIQVLLITSSICLILLMENSVEIFTLSLIYVLVNVLYTRYNLKRYELLGLCCVVSGFPIRFQIGTIALNQPTSSWGLLIVSQIAICLFLGKKVRRLSNSNIDKNLLSLQLALYSSITLTSCSYLIFAASSELGSNWNASIVRGSTLLFFLAMLRYAHLATQTITTQTVKTDLNDNLVRDVNLVFLVIAWMLVMFFARFFG